jgi:hypothetical protein
VEPPIFTAGVGISTFTENCNRDLNELYQSLVGVGPHETSKDVMRNTHTSSNGLFSVLGPQASSPPKSSQSPSRMLRKIDVLKVDAVGMLKNTNKEMKTLLHNLNKVVKNQGEDYHRELQEQ